MKQKATRKDINEKILSYWGYFYRHSLGLKDWRERASKRLNEEDIPKNEIVTWPDIKYFLRNRMVLDVGCGTGGFCIEARSEGAHVFGIDIDSKAIEICRLKASIHKIPLERFQVSTSESLPFEENTFDFIYCNSVLEHVGDVKKTISEMLRVTKQNGILFMKFPDYRSFYEAHYKIIWIPKMPRCLARLYLKIRGRPTEFINTINYITLLFIRKCLKNGSEIIKEKVIYGSSALEILHYRLLNIGRYIELTARKK